MPATSATPRRMANAVATASVLLAVHRTTDIPVRYSAFPEARSLPEGPMRGLTAIARRFLSLSFLFLFFFTSSTSLCPSLSFTRALLRRERERVRKRERDHRDTHFARKLYIYVYLYIYIIVGVPALFFLSDFSNIQLRMCSARQCKM